MAKEEEAVTTLPGVRSLAATKHVWLLDQFGVLHDGMGGRQSLVPSYTHTHVRRSYHPTV
jgi:hypothetical protein